MSVMSNGGLPPYHDVMRSLEEGSMLLRFYSKRRPEYRMFRVKLETRQLIWSRNVGGRAEGTVDLREVREVRPGKKSKDFERWVDEARRHDSKMCFVLLYGSEFRLKTLSLAARSTSEYDLWLHGLDKFMKDTQESCYTLQMERWLRKEFYGMDRNSSGLIALRDVKSWMPKVNYRIANNKLREKYQSLFHGQESSESKELNFESFALLYHKLIHTTPLFDEQFSPFFHSKENLSVEDFREFLLMEQKETFANDLNQVRKRMLLFLEDPRREALGVYFSKQEFMDFLYAEHNCIWNEQYDSVVQDMDQPLCNYWIASSHNTYLTGDQYSSDSSCEAYARVLRAGCRCIELDCWDGPDGLPHIYHGHTLTSKIRFIDVLKTIREHAWVASDYPLILSIENHCSLPQQRRMASAFKEVFGEMLLTQPIDPNATHLPSPNQLKRKIILKHKKLKLPEAGNADTRFTVPTDEEVNFTEADISNSKKNGILYLEDPIDKNEWNPHFFVLMATKLHYAEEQKREEDDADDDTNSTDAVDSNQPREELHHSEKWFHGALVGGRSQAEALLRQYSSQGDGTFLVRESDTFIGDFSLSFWRKGQLNHCRIYSRQDQGVIRYCLIDRQLFDCLYDLITHYRTVPLKSKNFEQTLTEPVPQIQSHVGKEWYNDNLSREQAEDMLCRIPQDGAFLIRSRQPSDHETDTSPYAISFRAEGKIKHCRIRQEGRLFTIGNASFESLVELVQYYERHPLYRKMKLRYPVNEQVVEAQGNAPNMDAIYSAGDLYTDPNHFNRVPSKISIHMKVRTLYEFNSHRDDELSFAKHVIIENVTKHDGGWWKGDYGGRHQKWFPSNFVEELVEETTDSPLGILQKGTFDLTGVSVDRLPANANSSRWVFRIMTPNAMVKEIAAPSEADMIEWIDAIRAASKNAENLVRGLVQIQREFRIAQELSDLIVYCRPVQFESNSQTKRNFYEMCSLPETKVERYTTKRRCKMLLELNKIQFSRIYPKGSRIESSNYDPVPMWASGCHMAALNYQTPDRSMQINEGLFKMNGKCGYVLQPDVMRQSDYDPFDKRSQLNVDPLSVSLTILGARHLVKSGRGIASSFVEVEVIGCSYDSNNKYKTGTCNDNGFNPVWNESCVFDILNPAMAMLRFTVYDEDMFGDPNFLGQATYPVKGIKQGYRSVQLLNGHSEKLELASLLVHIEMQNPQEEDSSMYSSIQKLRDQSEDLQIKLEEIQRVSRGNARGQQQSRSGPSEIEERLRQELTATEEQLLEMSMERQARRRATRVKRKRENGQTPSRK